ncbi:MAG TPA: RNA polymerase sigma factor [Polyangiaceae bacterium]|jgi:RNA polymerase sigma-70 factor (ECF subfamily)
MNGALPLPFALVGGGEVRAEARLVQRLRDGEMAALGEAYDAHHVHVRAFAQRMLGDDGAAEDLVQETFLELPRAIGRFREQAALRTFLISIAVNHARHHVRAAARRRAAAARYGHEPLPMGSGPAEALERAQLASQLMRALDALPIEQRAAIVLCDIEERTSVDAGEIVGAPEGTVRTRLFHARRKLAEALAELGSERAKGGR